MGGRTYAGLAQQMPQTGQGLGEPQPEGPRLPAPRLNQTHGQKALQDLEMFPDRLLGACDLSFAEASDSERIIQMFVAFHAMVVRDGLDPQVVHTAFLEIDEYRAIVDGIGGAESYEDI